MRPALRQLSILTSRPNSWWLALMLLLAVLVPSGCLLWFMGQAVQNEKLAVRQELTDAYRGSLSLAQGRLDTWRAQLAREMEPSTLSAPAFFSAVVKAGKADAVVCVDPAGKIIYPTPERPGKADALTLALQDRVRNLNKAGKKKEAVQLIVDAVNQGQMKRATDEEGRLIIPALELRALELTPTNKPGLLAKLQTELNDYENGMPAAQRRFVMRRLTELFPKQAAFATLPAEELAARYLEANPEPARNGTVTATALPGVWQMASASGQVLLLYQTKTLERSLVDAASPQFLPSAVSLAALPPGAGQGNYLITLPAGENFPGWQLALSLRDRRSFDAAASEQIASYVWIGVLTMSLVIILALLGAGLIRRQAAVARLRNDLLANVTHELKTPLSSMRLLVDTLLQSNPIREETARQYLQLIATENVRLSRLIDNFLTFSRIERKKHVFDFAEVPAATIVERAAAAVRERFAVGGCRFDVQAPASLPRVVADADAMITVLLNLLDNAWKYSGDEKQITLSAAARDGTVLFAVKDNGIGLSPRERKKVFKRFYQVDQRLARTGGGCGLGLSIVQYIVNAHHGAIRVESEPGHGSTFVVSLPIAPEPTL